MSLQSILNSKNAEIDILVKRFNSVYAKMYPEIFKEVQALFKRGIFNESLLREVFRNYGFDDLYMSFVDEFKGMIKFSKQVASEAGIGFVLNERNFALLDTVSMQIESNFNLSTNKFVNDLANAGLQSNLGGRSFNQVVTDLKTMFEGSNRRFETEAYTGITQFDNTLNKQLFDEAGIEKFVYTGPLDGRTRDACRSTLTDGKQETGWTREEVTASETPFITVGGYNCRHEWMPYIMEM